MTRVVVAGSFDDFGSRHLRLLHEASRLGEVHVFLWSDAVVRALAGRDRKFPQEERRYFLESVRYVSRVAIVDEPPDGNAASALGLEAEPPDLWVFDGRSLDDSGDGSDAVHRLCGEHGVPRRIFGDDDLEGFPPLTNVASGEASSRKKVLVTGCYDWFHSGHVRFFEEVSELGDLYVVVGHDANIRLLKGEGHPLFGQEERRYLVQGIRFVKDARVSTGHGWLDAEPEIAQIRPDIYAVNEDGDRPEKREFCDGHGIEYVVLKRLPKAGLPRRQSTDLRGF
jgi:cytidyltransferase-like protein